MSKAQVPGAVWIIALAIVNTLPMALQDAFPGAVWVPLAVDLLLVTAKAIQVYMPKSSAPGGPMPSNYVAPAAPAPASSKVRTFLVG